MLFETNTFCVLLSLFCLITSLVRELIRERIPGDSDQLRPVQVL